MCVILFKPSKTALPKEEMLKKMAKANDEGLGFMYPDGDRLVVGQKCKDFEELYLAVRGLDSSLPLIVHFRLATHGGKGIEYAQPFPFPVEEKAQLYETKWTASIGVAHNGVLSGFGDSMYHQTGRVTTFEEPGGAVKYWDCKAQVWVYVKKEDLKTVGADDREMSDTQDFLWFLSQDRDLAKAFIGWDKATLKLMTKLLGSKWAFMNGKGKVKLVGNWTQKKGLWFSNLFWAVKETLVVAGYDRRTSGYWDRTGKKWIGGHFEGNGSLAWDPDKHWDRQAGRWVGKDEKGDGSAAMMCSEIG